MGYQTTFSGGFTVTPPLKPEHAAYLKQFAEVRHVKRNPDLLADRPDRMRLIVGLPLGAEGQYFVGSHRYDQNVYNFQGNGDQSVVDPNGEPDGVPELWCQWVPNEDGTQIVWDEGEKFYEYVKWLEYLVEHFLKPWGYTITGEVRYKGGDIDDHGCIYAKDNLIEKVPDVNPGPSWLPAGRDPAPKPASPQRVEARVRAEGGSHD